LGTGGNATPPPFAKFEPVDVAGVKYVPGVGGVPEVVISEGSEKAGLSWFLDGAVVKDVFLGKADCGRGGTDGTWS
jgi:hypothetical protein